MKSLRRSIAGSTAALLAMTGPTVIQDSAGAPYRRSPDASLSVRPSQLVVTADQLARTPQFTVTNQADVALDVVTRVASFTAGPDGAPQVTADAPYSAAGWVTLRPDHFQLPGGAATQVALDIAVPANAAAGEHQLVVVFLVPPPAGRKGMSVRGAVGAPVYISARGQVVDSVDVLGLAAPRFAGSGPVTLTATFRNAGTTHRDFVDDRVLTARVAGTVVPFAGFTLLRDATQRVSAQWTNPPRWCVCRASVDVVNPDGSTRTATATIIVAPWQPIGWGAGFVLLAWVAWLVRRQPRRHRR